MRCKLSLCKNILKLSETRVWRTYSGGKNIDAFHGKEVCENGSFPEDWIASVVTAANPGREHIVEGLSIITNSDTELSFKDAIAKNPQEMLGSVHTQKFGQELGMLIKVIDAAERLTIQVHPDKTFAKEILNSDYGKTESWYILDCDPQAHIYLGFKPHVTRSLWEDIFHRQDIPAMLDCLHKIPVKAGDAFFIDGGVPHAIGQGCFLIEVQEPTDYTMRTELVTPAGLKISENQCHQGVGFDKMLDCFHYDSFTLEETLQKWRAEPKEVEAGIFSIIDQRFTDLFTLRVFELEKEIKKQRDLGLSVLVVLDGECELETEEECVSINKGDYIVLPAGIVNLTIRPKTNRVKMVECLPPR